MNRKTKKNLLVCTAMVVGLFAPMVVETAQAQFDFGDAPDGEPTDYPIFPPVIGNFPSLLSSDGARAVDITQMTLGPTADLEANALTVNADSDDGIVGMTLVLTSIPPPAWLEVGVSAGTGGTFWLNVLIDLNMDGEWGGYGAGGEYEWVVQNFQVSLPAGASEVVVPPPFAFGHGNRLPDGAWMRVALTDSPVGDPWSGSGEFAAGEIEDYVVTLPPLKGDMVTVVWDPPSPIKVDPPAEVELTATVTVTPDPVPDPANPMQVSFDLTKMTGTVTIVPVKGGYAIPPALNPWDVLFDATVPKDAKLPSTWQYHFRVEDPPTYVTATDVVIGFGDTVGILDFVPDDGTIYIDDDWALPPSTAILAGFLWRVHQVASGQPDTIARAEAQLAGELGENIADPAAIGVALGEGMLPELPGGPLTFEIDSVINLNQFGELSEGSFPNDGQMPGIPGLTGSDDNIAAEVLAWLDLPEGRITMGVNSDDGFRLEIGGAGFGDRFAINVGEFDGGRAPTDSIFSFVVRKAGLYPARLIWEEGLWGAALEWFTIREDGAKVLVNDLENGGIAAYRAISGAPRAVAEKVVPQPYAVSVPRDTAIEVHLREGAFPVHTDSIRLDLDGNPVEPAVHKLGDVIQVKFQLPDRLDLNSIHRATLSFIDRVAVVRHWEFGPPPIADPLLPEGVPGGDGHIGIREVINNGGIGDQTACYASLYSGAGTIVDYTASVLNIHDGGGNGNYDNDDDFGVVTAGRRAYGTVDDASLMARGIIRVPTGQGGDWTFGVNSDDGFTLQLRGSDFVSAVNGEIANFVGGAALRFHGGRSTADTLGVIDLAPGDHPFWMTFHDGLGGAAVELYAAKGAHSAFDPAVFRLVGHKSVGEVPMPGLCDEVTMVASRPGAWSGGQIASLQNASDALAEGEVFGTNSSGNYAVVNHSDPDDGSADPGQTGLLMGDVAFPNNGAGDDDDFGVMVTGLLDIPVAGRYQLGFNSDDGAALRIKGQVWTSVVTDATGNAAIFGDQLINDTLTARSFTAGEIYLPKGCHEFVALMFDRNFGSFFELFGRGISPTSGKPNPTWYPLRVDGAHVGLDFDGLQLVAAECFPACHPDYSKWVGAGKPDCWCNPTQCHGDADGQIGGSVKTGRYYAGPGDLNVLQAAWLVRQPPHGPGIESVADGICADFAHDVGGSGKTGFYHVGPTDLNVLIANWLLKEPPQGPGIIPDCLNCP
ncbi:MAG: hypothetical protein JSW27_01090 [Phycisphaerales bacterium]|nr:MAG: hypothetical protein JSW27_01090 [Phycisphaerales bacterium]